MKRTGTLTRSTAVLALTLSLGSLGLAGCGSESDTEGTDTASESTSQSEDMSEDMSEDESMSEDMSEDESMDEGGADPAAQTFGEGCAAVPTSGDGSFDGMATEPVATAASANPLLKTLVKAVKKAGLVDDLNSAEGLTVFAPTDDAFGAIPPKDLKAVLKDKATLTTILTHHVVSGQLAPDALAGDHETLAGDMLSVTGSGEDFQVGAEKAAVLCGNIPTANATVYVIDTVLMPEAG